MPAAKTLDIDFVRGHFPGINECAFFENAGGTFVPQSVIDRVRAYMQETQVQPGGVYGVSERATERIAQSQKLMAHMINADPEEIAIGPSTTMNVYVLAHALRDWFRPGDELIVTNLDHEANSGAWRRLAEYDVVVKEWPINPETAELETEVLERLLTGRTRLVCFTHCSNITGSINDAAALIRRVHDAGALACVDAVAYAPHRLLDVKALDVDFYLFSAYKLYGPHLGLLYGKREHLLRARGQNHFFIDEDEIPLKLVPGGVNHELTAGLTGIVDYFDALYRHHFSEGKNSLHERLQAVFDLISSHEQTLATRFIEFLKSKPDVRVIGRARSGRAQRVPPLSFVVNQRDSNEFPDYLAERGVAIRAGGFYAERCIEALGLGRQNGVVRASMVHYNSRDEVDRLIEHLDNVL
jgi:cysteine desulfurase family protein (TIGR01976 family)